MPIERLKRAFRQREARRWLSPGIQTAAFFIVLALLTCLVAWLDPRPSLRHVQIAMLSGSTTGNYYSTVEKVGAETARRKGRVSNLSSAGSVENIDRLIAGAKNCTVHFALVQDGITYPEGHQLEVIGRLPRPESLVILGRNVDRITAASDLKGFRIGIGPVGSGTEHMMRRVLTLLEGVGLQASTLAIDEQLVMVQRGQLDLAAMVLDDEGKLLQTAMAKLNLDILELPDMESLARHLRFARVGVIAAGQMDYVRKLPRKEKKVLQLDALIVSNGCAPDGVTQGFLTAVAEVFPTFIRHNKNQPNLTGLPMSAVAVNFYTAEGPDLLGKYAPWAVNIMPQPTWIQLGVAFSILFSGMALWHRYRLWRVDVNRVKIERDVAVFFGTSDIMEAIAATRLDPRGAGPDAPAQIDKLMQRLSELSEKCRKQSLSLLVPMGEEMQYRYQEMLIAELQRALARCKQQLAER
ncbi:MAG: Immunogenic protein [Betaproteobacteria bacterium]|nr:Immunogenic protein [Betaproteobacteria bacterium]